MSVFEEARHAVFGMGRTVDQVQALTTLAVAEAIARLADANETIVTEIERLRTMFDQRLMDIRDEMHR